MGEVKEDMGGSPLRGSALASGNSPSLSTWGSASRSKGPVEMLCDEIGFAFDKRLERPDVLVAFVRELVDEIAEDRYLQGRLAAVGAPAPSEASGEALELMRATMTAQAPAGLRNLAAAVHDAADRLGPPEDGPADHLLDMLSSCASAIRFGLETPCHSRHAAHAAQHVWKQLYGLRRFDRHSGQWEKDWARAKLLSAIIAMLPVSPAKAYEQKQAPQRSETERSTNNPAALNRSGEP